MRLPTLLAVGTVGAAAILASAPAAYAAPASPTTGQPSMSCDDFPGSAPAGFGTGGFATAEAVYAGSFGTPSLAHGSSVAVSQYDVACYQLSLHR